MEKNICVFILAAILMVKFDESNSELLIDTNETVKSAYQGDIITIIYTVVHDDSMPELHPVIDDETVATIESVNQVGSEDSTTTYNASIKSVFLGKTFLTFLGSNASSHNSSVQDIQKVYISVLRSEQDSTLTEIFSGVLGILIFINTFIMGLQLDHQILLSIAKKPVAPAIGFFCQYGCMPLIATGWGYALLQEYPNLMLGLFTVGCCPGGGQSNMMTILFDGNINLSIAMTFVSNIAALVMMPFWLFTLGQVFIRQLGEGDSTLQIPFQNIMVSLILLLTPVFLGMMVKYFRPNAADVSKRIIKYTSSFMILIMVPAGLYINFYLFYLITWKTVPFLNHLSCTILLVICFIAVHFIFDCCWYVTAIYWIHPGLHSRSNPQPSPDNDLTLVMPFCVIVTTPIPLICLLLAMFIWRKLHTAKPVTTASESDDDNVQDSGVPLN